MTRILIIHGHPSKEGLTGDLARAYADGALAAGAEVRTLELGELQFDPSLHQGFKGDQPLEPDLRRAQEDLLWAEHLVWAFPVWWGGWPALLKGFVDRVFLPGFAFKYRSKGLGWDKLLRGRTARILVTSGAPSWWDRLMNRDAAVRQLRRSTLKFCGIGPVRVTRVGLADRLSEGARHAHLDRARSLGRTEA